MQGTNQLYRRDLERREEEGRRSFKLFIALREILASLALHFVNWNAKAIGERVTPKKNLRKYPQIPVRCCCKSNRSFFLSPTVNPGVSIRFDRLDPSAMTQRRGWGFEIFFLAACILREDGRLSTHVCLRADNCFQCSWFSSAVGSFIKFSLCLTVDHRKASILPFNPHARTVPGKSN